MAAGQPEGRAQRVNVAQRVHAPYKPTDILRHPTHHRMTQHVTSGTISDKRRRPDKLKKPLAPALIAAHQRFRLVGTIPARIIRKASRKQFAGNQSNNS